MRLFEQYEQAAMRTAGGQSMEYHGLKIASEAGEIAGLIGKHVGQGHPFDVEHGKEEAGDLLWHLTAYIHEVLHSTLEEVAVININKLKKRYPEGFSAERSLHRDGNGSVGHG